jgi:hypothetical protein
MLLLRDARPKAQANIQTIAKAQCTTTAHGDRCDCPSCPHQDMHTSSMVGKRPACTNSVLQSPDPCTVAANLPRRAFPNQLSGPMSDAHTAAPAHTARSKATVGKALNPVWVTLRPIGSRHIFSALFRVLSRYSQQQQQQQQLQAQLQLLNISL